MNLRQQVKYNAKNAMRNHYGKAVAILLILFAVGMIFFLFNALFIRILNMQSFSRMFLYRITFFGQTAIVNIAEPIVCAVSAVFAFIAITPLMLGVTRWYYHLTDGKADEVSSIFDYYVSGRMFFRSLWFAFHMGVRRVFWYLLFMLPGCALFSVSAWMYWYFDINNENVVMMGMVLFMLAAFITVVMALLCTIFSLRYYLADMIVVSDDKISTFQAVRQSVRYMKGNRVDIFIFGLSFLPWILLCVFIVPIVFVVPYIKTSSIIYARYLYEKGRLSQQPGGQANANREEETQVYQRASAQPQEEEPMVDILQFDQTPEHATPEETAATPPQEIPADDAQSPE